MSTETLAINIRPYWKKALTRDETIPPNTLMFYCHAHDDVSIVVSFKNSQVRFHLWTFDIMALREWTYSIEKRWRRLGEDQFEKQWYRDNLGDWRKTKT